MKLLFISFLFTPYAVASQSINTAIVQMDSLFKSYFKQDEPGGAVLLVKDGKILYQNSFGLADIHTKEPITTKTLFNVGSITKTFVAYGILKLAAEKRLSLQDELWKYFSDFKNTDIARKIKLYHLLTHTSGIPDTRPVKAQHDFYLTARDEENFEPLKQTDTLEFEPGTKYHYSNPAFNGLALIIEKVTGKKWQDYIAETIFRPSGMRSSTITDGPHPEKGVSHAYILNDKKEFEELDYGEEPTFAAAGNGGVWSSVEELWIYEQAIQKNLFLDSDWINKSRTIYPFPEWRDNTVSRLGLSWFITKEAEQDMIGHTGSQGGFISDYCWLSGEKIFYVLLCNVPKPIKEIRAGVFRLLQKDNWLN